MSPTKFTRRRLVAIDLFAGVGGLSLGFEQAGFDVLAALEYDPIHATTHHFNFPLTEVLCRDARQVGAHDLLEAARRGWRRHHPTGPAWDGVVDAVIGGPSCQGFSVGGRRQLDDERNQLLLEFVRLVVEIRPQVFCLENVPGLLEPRHDEVREQALASLAEAGYCITGSDGPLNAADFGVPQNRRRLLVVGSLVSPITISRASKLATVTVEQAFDGLPDPSRYEGLWVGDSVELSTSDIASLDAATSNYARYMSGVERDPLDRARPRQWNRLRLTNSLLTRHSTTSIERFDATPQGKEEPVSRCYRLDPCKQARTLRAGTGRERGAFTSPRPVHPYFPRAITVREAARLHSFPDWFRFNVTNWHGHRQIGNSVPPLLARGVGIEIARSLGSIPSRGRVALPFGKETLLRMSPQEALIAVAGNPNEAPPPRKRKPRVRASTSSTSRAAVIHPVSVI
ncbi:DNA cytosine methyltransferase [Nonomuraea sp. NPDC050404]|uniref:DNA cytosine methyltransferase n=1 Tax=Nonomuraea sp. NPDC050404 TaxID=3155783 RepID=UPI0033DC0338